LWNPRAFSFSKRKGAFIHKIWGKTLYNDLGGGLPLNLRGKDRRFLFIKGIIFMSFLDKKRIKRIRGGFYESSF